MTYSLEHLGAEYTETGTFGSEGEVSRIIPGIDSNFFVDETGENMIPFLKAVAKTLFSDARYIRIKRRLYKWCNTHYEYRGDDLETQRVLAIARIYNEFGARYFAGKS